MLSPPYMLAGLLKAALGACLQGAPIPGDVSQHIRSAYRAGSERHHGQWATRQSLRLAGDDIERRACRCDGDAAPSVGPGFFRFPVRRLSTPPSATGKLSGAAG